MQGIPCIRFITICQVAEEAECANFLPGRVHVGDFLFIKKIMEIFFELLLFEVRMPYKFKNDWKVRIQTIKNILKCRNIENINGNASKTAESTKIATNKNFNYCSSVFDLSWLIFVWCVIFNYIHKH